MYSYKLPGGNPMRLTRLKAILLQELYITKHSFEVFMDIFFFPLVSIVVFGFLSSYLVGSTSSTVAHSILMAMILWQLAYIIQYSISVGSLWNIWSRNLSNLFIAPLGATEYISAHTISGIIKSMCMLILSALISYFVFHLNIFSIGIGNMVFFFLNLMLFAFSIGIMVLGLIFRYGTRIQAFAWGLMPLFQPLTATFYPVSILPRPLQYVAAVLPPTYVFEGLRAAMQHPDIQWSYINTAMLENIFYFIVAVWFFNMMFRKSKETGQFARNES